MTAKRALIVFLLIIIVVMMVILSGCIAPPKGNPEGTSGTSGSTSGSTSGGTSGGTKSGGSAAATTPTVTPDTIEAGYLTPVTPFPVETTPRPTSGYTVLPDITPNMTEFVAIFYNTIAFRQNKTAYSYDLKNPPLVIEMCIKPNMTTRTIWYESKYKDQDDVTKKVTTISPGAWFEVTVRDPVTGNILAREGFARSYSVDTAKKLTLRSPGSYLIEFSGNDLSAEIQMQVPKTGDQTGEPARNLSCRGPLL
jgi:hypothetical protein